MISKANCCGRSRACPASRSRHPTNKVDYSISVPGTWQTARDRSMRFVPERQGTFRCKTARHRMSGLPGARRRPRRTTHRRWSTAQLVRAVRQRDGGLLQCARWSEIYGRQRIPKGGATTASPWAYDDKVFCLNEDGVTCVLKADTQFELLYTNTLADDDMCMATPAIADSDY